MFPSQLDFPGKMMNSIDEMVFVSSNGEDPYIDFSEWAKGVTVYKSDLDKVGDFLVMRRRERTVSGIDVRGEPFHPYSPGYAARKGRSNVDLISEIDHPHMVDALDYRSYAEARYSNVGEVRGNVVTIGIFGNMDMLTRARIHDQGAVIRNVNYRRMEPSGKYRPLKKKSTVRGKHRSTFTTIPQREWMTPSEEDISDATEVFLESMWSRLGDSPGHKEPIVRRVVQSMPNAGKFSRPPNRGWHR